MLDLPPPIDARAKDHASLHDRTLPPISMSSGYVGPVWLSGTGRMIWWMGRVAIGLRYQARRSFGSSAQPSDGLES